MCQSNSAKIYSKKILTGGNAVYFRLCIDWMHITPPVTAEGYDGSHHQRRAEWVILLELFGGKCSRPPIG